MKTKHTLIIIAIALVLIAFGALFNIVRIQIGFITGDFLLTVGMVLKIVGVILFLYKLFTHPNFKDFLNS